MSEMKREECKTNEYAGFGEKNIPRISIVGIGMGTCDTLTVEAQQVIRNADAVIGASRMLQIYDSSDGLKTLNSMQSEEQKPYFFEEYRAKEIIEIIRSHPEYRTWAIAMSGDLGFYSGAKKMMELMREEGMQVNCIPGIASVVYLAAKVGVSWEDAALRSIHGRDQNIVFAIDHHEKIFLLLGRDGGEVLCEKLKTYGFDDVICHIGNRLSYPDQNIVVKKGKELCPEDIGELSTVLIVNQKANEKTGSHYPDEAFIRMAGPGGVPMTKDEVRAVSVAKLALTKNAVVYDIGAGTGSVSIEAALSGEKIQVFAVEKREDAAELIEKNQVRFRADNIHVIRGTAPDALFGLPAPTHVFIGGSSGNLKEILVRVKEKNPKVRIVINAISMETLSEVTACIKEGILKEPEIIQMNIARSRKLGEYHMMTGQNPIYIISVE